MIFFMLINVKMPTVVGILTFISRKNFMLNCVEYEISFITSDPDFAESEEFAWRGRGFVIYCNSCLDLSESIFISYEMFSNL